MKTILFLLSCLLLFRIAFAQADHAELMLNKIAAEKNEDKRFDLILDFFAETQESNPVLDMQNAQKLLRQSHNTGDHISEAAALGEIGFNYWSFGNTVKHLEYSIESVKVAEATGNKKIIALAKNFLGHNYSYYSNSDSHEAIRLYREAEQDAVEGKSEIIQSWALMNLGSVYYASGMLDSALSYTQKTYELITRIRYTQYLGYVLIQFGDLHARMGNTALALNYYAMAVREATKARALRFVNIAYSSVAHLYNSNKQTDSAAVYARKAIETVQNTPYVYLLSGQPAQLLLNIYKKRNSDSALKYSEMYRIANDSLYNARNVQQTQTLKFENELHQQELELEKIKLEERRKENIQYASMGLGIIILIGLFLLLSRSFITNARYITFFGVLALLILFEFLNLLLHPLLENLTNHSPILMLVALVSIASLLIPLHHKLEKWATAKLVEKNRQIRLAAAKKTIRELGEV